MVGKYECKTERHANDEGASECDSSSIGVRKLETFPQ